MGELLYDVPKVGFSPIKMIRELALERCEIIRSIFGVGVRALRGFSPITIGSGRMPSGVYHKSLFKRGIS